MEEKKYFTTPELAKILGLSRQAVFKKVKSGQIKATKVGKTFIISREDLPEILGQVLSDRSKVEIEAIVKRLIKEYGETLQLLAKE